MTEETWKDIPGYPNYQASSLGNIRSIVTRRYNRLPAEGEVGDAWEPEHIGEVEFNHGATK